MMEGWKYIYVNTADKRKLSSRIVNKKLIKKFASRNAYFAVSTLYILRNLTREKYFQESTANCDLAACTQNCRFLLCQWL